MNSNSHANPGNPTLPIAASLDFSTAISAWLPARVLEGGSAIAPVALCQFHTTNLEDGVGPDTDRVPTNLPTTQFYPSAHLAQTRFGARLLAAGRCGPDEGSEPINLALRAHQAGAQDWDFRQTAADLHQWAQRMVVEFKLQVPVPCLMVERLRGRCGHFRYGRNGFGLVDEIALDQSHVTADAYAEVLDTLLHELLHSWQKHHGRPGRRNYHNREFRQKALVLGLVIDAQGYGGYVPGDTPFTNLLRRYGVEVPVRTMVPARQAARVGSKLKLYVCACGVRVRVGRATFNARCLDCGGRFELVTSGSNS